MTWLLSVTLRKLRRGPGGPSKEGELGAPPLPSRRLPRIVHLQDCIPAPCLPIKQGLPIVPVSALSDSAGCTEPYQLALWLGDFRQILKHKTLWVSQQTHGAPGKQGRQRPLSSGYEKDFSLVSLCFYLTFWPQALLSPFRIFLPPCERRLRFRSSQGNRHWIIRPGRAFFMKKSFFNVCLWLGAVCGFM